MEMKACFSDVRRIIERRKLGEGDAATLRISYRNYLNHFDGELLLAKKSTPFSIHVELYSYKS